MSKKVNAKDLAKAAHRFTELVEDVRIKAGPRVDSKKVKRDAKAVEAFAEGHKAGFMAGLDFLAEMAKEDPEVWEVGMKPEIFLPFYAELVGGHISTFIGED